MQIAEIQYFGRFGFVRYKWIRHLLSKHCSSDTKKRILGYANTNMTTNFRSYGNSWRQQGFQILGVWVGEILWAEPALFRINKMHWHKLHASDYISVELKFKTCRSAVCSGSLLTLHFVGWAIEFIYSEGGGGWLRTYLSLDWIIKGSGMSLIRDQTIN